VEFAACKLMPANEGSLVANIAILQVRHLLTSRSRSRTYYWIPTDNSLFEFLIYTLIWRINLNLLARFNMM